MNNTVEKVGIMGTEIMVQTLTLNTKNLTSGANYQRPIDQKKIGNIVSTYDPHKLGIIKVSFRDGKYWVYDGQHRLMVLKTINQGMDCIIPCEVHYGLSYNDEARLFAEQYDGATKVDIIYKLKALYEAGDEETVKLKNIIEDVGLIIDFTKCKGVNKVVAVDKVKKVYNDLGEEGLRKVLYLIKNAWNGQSTSLNKNLIGGVHLFVKTYKDLLSEETFIKAFQRVEPIEIKRRGDSDHSAKGDLKYAKVILDQYNSVLFKKNRLEYDFKG